MSFLLAALLLQSYVPYPPLYHLPPQNVNLSAVREIICEEGTGSGFIIGDGIIATANHVAELTNCHDGQTKKAYKTYLTDEKHDFALMSGETPVIPPMKVGCSTYKKGDNYVAYGHSAYRSINTFFRAAYMVGTGLYPSIHLDGDPVPTVGMAQLDGQAAPGMSGGPVLDANLRVIGLVTAGTRKGVFYSFELINTPLCKR